MTKAKADQIDGKFTGATRLPDGRIKVAPMHIDAMHDLMDRQAGLEIMLTRILEFEANEMKRIVHAKRLWWLRITEDLDILIDAQHNWSFDGQYIIPLPVKPATTPPGEESA